MPKRYEVLERSFINGRLYEPGETVALEIDSPGGNLKPLGAPMATQANGPGGGGWLGYVAARGAAGKFVIKDGNEQRVGDFIGNKAEAEAEAARLNEGGDITKSEHLGQQDAGNNDQADDGDDTGNDTDLPDA